MLQKLSNLIQQKFPFLKEKKLLIAISGGIDSVVLTHLLSALNFNISLVHCNFNLRNTESDLDTVFVKELAEKLQIKCFTTSFETEKIAKENKESIQITARNFRYTWFLVSAFCTGSPTLRLQNLSFLFSFFYGPAQFVLIPGTACSNTSSVYFFTVVFSFFQTLKSQQCFLNLF